MRNCANRSVAAAAATLCKINWLRHFDLYAAHYSNVYCRMSMHDDKWVQRHVVNHWILAKITRDPYNQYIHFIVSSCIGFSKHEVHLRIESLIYLRCWIIARVQSCVKRFTDAEFQSRHLAVSRIKFRIDFFSLFTSSLRSIFISFSLARSLRVSGYFST